MAVRSKVARGKGAEPGRSGAPFRKSPSVVLENRLGNPGRPAPPPRAAPRRCPLTFPAPPHWLREPDSGGRSLQAVCLGPRLIFWFGDRRRFWFGEPAPFLVWGTGPRFLLLLSSSRPTKTERICLGLRVFLPKWANSGLPFFSIFVTSLSPRRGNRCLSVYRSIIIIRLSCGRGRRAGSPQTFPPHTSSPPGADSF